MRYLLLDRIDELQRHVFAVGTKAVTLAEDVFEHHFPGHPVYPGALLQESMSQLGGALLELSLHERLGYWPRCVVSSVKAKFRDFVRPGDSVVFRAEIVSAHDDSALVKAHGDCGARRVCEAELIFVFLRVDDPRLQAARQENLDVLMRGAKVTG